MGRLQPALLCGIAVDLVLADQIKYQIGGTADHLVQTLAPFGAEFSHGVVGIMLGIGWNDLAVVAARGAEARLFGLHQNHIGATLGQMQGGGQTGKTGTNHHHIRRPLALQGGAFRRGRGGMCP